MAEVAIIERKELIEVKRVTVVYVVQIHDDVYQLNMYSTQTMQQCQATFCNRSDSDHFPLFVRQWQITN